MPGCWPAEGFPTGPNDGYLPVGPEERHSGERLVLVDDVLRATVGKPSEPYGEVLAVRVALAIVRR
jgi:hypothetical protein